ncbi:MAG: glycosyltransferase family 9 protein [Bacteroidales bacterium]|nr:glycosyltransferase family 9 protein [Bacteroidales bacterium]
MALISDHSEIHKILIIQTASAGDVILATPVVEKLHHRFPSASVDFLLKKGNETLFTGHPFIHELMIWDKSRGKYKALFRLYKKIRVTHYDLIVNIQRFFSTGFITAFSGARIKAGFSKNPFSGYYTIRSDHGLSGGIHETERNLGLIESIAGPGSFPVKLYPGDNDFMAVEAYKRDKYICIAPASLWFTKQYPPVKWKEFVREVGHDTKIFFLGSGNDYEFCNDIIKEGLHRSSVNLAGKLTFLQTAALMKDAMMNFVNDSAPMHLASAMNAPVTAVYCSTVPSFGFGPLSDDSVIVETGEKLDCRPCGLHGRPECPEGHFKCALTIRKEDLLKRIHV